MAACFMIDTFRSMRADRRGANGSLCDRKRLVPRYRNAQAASSFVGRWMSCMVSGIIMGLLPFGLAKRRSVLEHIRQSLAARVTA